MKTAVEWYSEQLKDKLGQIVINQNWKLFDEIIEQAKKIEKEQIVNSYKEGHYHLHLDSFNPEQYYNETFKKEQ
jgi:hypothetical protein